MRGSSRWSVGGAWRRCAATGIIWSAAIGAGPGDPAGGGAHQPHHPNHFTCLTPNPVRGADGLYRASPWPGGVVPYTFLTTGTAAPTPAQRTQMLAAMADIEAATSVQFVERISETNFVRIRRNSPGVSGSFSSHIGYCGCGMQEIVIGDNNWIEPGVLIHEWGHALGLFHEHQRDDRDAFITVHPAVAGSGAFVKIPGAIKHGPYDMASLMHYDPLGNVGGYTDRVLTVTPTYRRAWQYRIGQYRRFDAVLSNGDLWVLHALYPGDPPPRAFSLTSPASGAAVGAAWIPSFSWAASDAATGYRLQVDDSPAFTSPVIDVETTLTSYDHGAALTAGQLYWWRVTASNAAGVTLAYPFDKVPFYTAAAYPAALYVDDDAPAGGDGASWAAPLQDLAVALEVAHAADGAVTEIRVAGGVYRPDFGTGDYTLSFWLADACSLLGGYAGYGAPDPGARDIDLYQTVLSGDLNGDDLPGFINIDDNARNVIISLFNPSSTLMEGFTIRAGRADTWHDSLIGVGGGAAISGGSPVFRRCRFEGNYAEGLGAGVHISLSAAAPTLDACEIVGNRAELWGAGLRLWNAAATVIDCVIAENVAATDVGGGAVVQGSSEAKFINALFIDNVAGAFGGGGLWAADGSEARVFNGTFNRNTAPPGTAGALQAQRGGRFTVVNSILWGDSVPQVAILGPSTADITYTDVRGGWPGVGNINADPLFAAPGAGDYTLGAGSPAIDAGDSLSVPAGVTTDLAGLPRFVGAVDMGAYEFQDACYADCDQSGSLDFFDFLCFQNAFAAGDPDADCDDTGSLDFFDFLCFQNAFAAGCP